MPEIPKKLHHYTSVEALKSILTYQTKRNVTICCKKY